MPRGSALHHRYLPYLKNHNVLFYTQYCCLSCLWEHPIIVQIKHGMPLMGPMLSVSSHKDRLFRDIRSPVYLTAEFGVPRFECTTWSRWQACFSSGVPLAPVGRRLACSLYSSMAGSVLFLMRRICMCSTYYEEERTRESVRGGIYWHGLSWARIMLEWDEISHHTGSPIGTVPGVPPSRLGSNPSSICSVATPCILEYSSRIHLY